MENLTSALYMAFAFMMFVGGFSYSLYMVNKLNTTANTLLYRLDETNYYETVELNSLMSSDDNSNNKAYKVVGIDSIISTLYRYYNESFCVKIEDEKGNLLQIFDTTTETNVRAGTRLDLSNLTTDDNKKYSALLSLYDNSNSACYMFGAPWQGSSEDVKTRIDMYIAGNKGYINGIFVDYSKTYDIYINSTEISTTAPIYLNYFKDRKFKEIFSEYTYEGDTLTVGEDDYETLTGTSQSSTKIVITYQLISE